MTLLLKCVHLIYSIHVLCCNNFITNWFTGATVTRGRYVSSTTLASCTELPASGDLPLTSIKLPWPNTLEGTSSQFEILFTFKNVLANMNQITVKVYVPAEEPSVYKTQLKVCDMVESWTELSLDKLKFSCDCYNYVCPFVQIHVLNHNSGFNINVCDWEIV